MLILQNNTGNTTQDYTPYMFDSVAKPISGEAYVKSIKMTFLERRMDDKDDPFNLQEYDGPTIVLVKTAEWPTRTSARVGPATPTSSRWGDGEDSDDEDDDDDGRPKLRAGSIAGIVIGAIVAAVLMFMCCWRGGCCGCAGKKGERGAVDKERQRYIIEQGNELMMQKGVGGKVAKTDGQNVLPVTAGRGGRDDADEIARAEQARVLQKVELRDEPPPRYEP